VGRGIEGGTIFRGREDREDFLGRLGGFSESRALTVYSWALMDNHFRLFGENRKAIPFPEHAEAANGVRGKF
jgi:hypothetical protein